MNTAYESRISDWSSDVCSSDLEPALGADFAGVELHRVERRLDDRPEAGVRLHARIAVVAIDRGLALVEFRIDTSLRVLVHLRDGVFQALRVDADLGAERVDAVGAVVEIGRAHV